MDMLGHGLAQSGKVKIDHTIHYIHSIMESEGYKKAHFVGVSMGSLIAQYFALHYPDKLHTMTVEFYMIENVGHYANMDDAEAFNRIVMKFISKNNHFHK